MSSIFYILIELVRRSGAGGRLFRKGEGVGKEQGPQMCIRDRVRDTSKKIKAVKRSKGMSGKPVTSKPVYGYLKMCIRDRYYVFDWNLFDFFCGLFHWAFLF